MGIIFDIQRFSLHDGPGIRTTVFFKGCNLRCVWCHNPESLLSKEQLSYTKSFCTLCGECTRVCLHNVHKIEGNVHTIDFDSCIACGKCPSVCVKRALRIIGYEASAQEIMQVVLKDKKYYDTSGGGLTTSGGEPTFQFKFLLELLSLAKQNKIHTCVETNGIFPEYKLNELLPFVDLFLVDYKHSNPLEHKKYTGGELKNVMETLSLLDAYNKPVLLRCPIIHGINDNEAHFETIRNIKQSYKNIIDFELMSYHEAGNDKWEQIGLQYLH
jgi:pyruvate formate lyase activating enzyme